MDISSQRIMISESQEMSKLDNCFSLLAWSAHAGQETAWKGGKRHGRWLLTTVPSTAIGQGLMPVLTVRLVDLKIYKHWGKYTEGHCLNNGENFALNQELFWTEILKTISIT